MRRLSIAMVVVISLCAQEKGQEEVKLEPLITSITVSEKITAEAPGAVVRLDAGSVESRPGINLDDRLRDVPGFTLFRRTSSLVANPGTQGVSLRGLGPSGASRTLVLLDGIPVNDPFGGWVYWTRFNPDTIERIEISRGASTSVFGDRAMGGVVSLLTPTPRTRYFGAAFEGGNAGVRDAKGTYSDLFGAFGVSAFTRIFSSEGYYIVPESVRGKVDQKAGVDYVVGDLKLDYFSKAQRLSLKTNLLAEERNNGTAVQQNSTSLGTIGLHYSRERLSLSVYHSRQEFHSGFSFVAPGRNTERATFRQSVPSEETGAVAMWRRSTAAWNLMLGADLRRPSGESRDTLLSPTPGLRVGGGDYWQQGLFAQSDLALGRVRFYGGLRHDFTGRGNTFLSPSGGVVISDGPRRWRASAYRSFRAPTLNELFRAFSVGNTFTLPNNQLRPETLAGGEAGLDWQTRTVVVRGTLFYNSIDDLVGNVTVSTTPSLILRKKQNMTGAVTRGAEVDVEKAFRRVRASASYLFVDARVNSGLRIPQVAKHQGSAQLVYHAGRSLASAGVRGYGLQFDDDVNNFLLPGYATVQVLVRERLGRGFSAMLALENLLDRRYLVAKTPNPNIGGPRLWRAGLRWESGQ